MADEPPPPGAEPVPETRAVTIAEAILFLQAKRTNSVCPHCGTNAWDMGHEYDGTALIDAGVSNANVSWPAPYFVRAFHLTCKNCGFLEFVLVDTVARWLREHADGR
jgi:predicted nucleic-acid-binding Zn-ribbon protein